ncbi:hypothetical protein EKL98_09220 [Flavobacterium bomense]|uniref:Uncharacterized protein n=1 Tax=Flavobacterium bomense TaxID=2497483 RepID=A0A3S0PIK9_9FLAO|nr:hypothetical protein [Flavobacterium bomense]RTZ04357.1 hypothetical protein EKL98_09220 [Flavobacterium bomense]
MKYNFETLEEVLTAVMNSNFNRNFTSIIAMAYIFEEDDSILFNEENFKGLGFLFDFFNLEQFDLSDQEFKEIITNLLSLKGKINIVEIKKILYHKQLKLYEEKFNGNLISNETYKILLGKILE